jgi:hypothetical protein
LLDIIQTRPYKVIKKVSKGAFRLDLPKEMYIYPIILVIYLKPAIPNLYNRTSVNMLQIKEHNIE